MLKQRDDKDTVRGSYSIRSCEYEDDLSFWALQIRSVRDYVQIRGQGQDCNVECSTKFECECDVTRSAWPCGSVGFSLGETQMHGQALSRDEVILH